MAPGSTLNASVRVEPEPDRVVTVSHRAAALAGSPGAVVPRAGAGTTVVSTAAGFLEWNPEPQAAADPSRAMAARARRCDERARATRPRYRGCGSETQTGVQLVTQELRVDYGLGPTVAESRSSGGHMVDPVRWPADRRRPAWPERRGRPAWPERHG